MAVVRQTCLVRNRGYDQRSLVFVQALTAAATDGWVEPGRFALPQPFIVLLAGWDCLRIQGLERTQGYREAAVPSDGTVSTGAMMRLACRSKRRCKAVGKVKSRWCSRASVGDAGAAWRLASRLKFCPHMIA
jgi:hypothetical protein